ncbi:MAG: class I SAM-dependent methyltransferase, partial [Oscillospiraceae bacterium]|nr:class I SAM-dependent methyltransferase [Oscillospiraceae bacterium]
LADNCFVYEAEDGMCVWQNELQQNGSVDLQVDIFSRNADGSYSRDTDCFTEILIPHDAVLQTLENCGLALIDLLDGESYGPVCETSQRILYVTRKK